MIPITNTEAEIYISTEEDLRFIPLIIIFSFIEDAPEKNPTKKCIIILYIVKSILSSEKSPFNMFILVRWRGKISME